MTIELINEVEQALGVRYPDSFRVALPEFSTLCDKEPFKAEFITSLEDVSQIQAEIPKGLLPFMREERTHWFDIYTFDTLSVGPDYRVVVWADHAIIAEWENFGAFASWLQDWLKRQAGPSAPAN